MDCSLFSCVLHVVPISMTLCNFLHPPTAPSLLGPYKRILLSILLYFGKMVQPHISVTLCGNHWTSSFWRSSTSLGLSSLDFFSDGLHYIKLHYIP
jgi:hypothetical protein